MEPATRQERREERRKRERERMAKHGSSLRRVYRDAILKRVENLRRAK